MNTENITVNTHSSIRIEGSLVIYFDPFQITDEKHDADYVFITHSHYDHLDPDSIRRVSKKGTVFAAPESIRQEMRDVIGQEAELIGMEPGDVQEKDGIKIQAVPAYNRLKPFHPKKNRWIGYVVTMDGVRYYTAGDTDAVKELSEVSCDVAMVPIGGTYTMTAKDAAGLINEIRPGTAIPTHYGNIVGKKEDAQTFAKHVDQDIAVEFKL